MISVIIPVYQVQAYLERCIDSILNQNYHDIEIILVDDGSTDGSEEICDRYAALHKNITVIHKPNGGLSSARNTGIEKAAGDYIFFVDSDDMIHPDLLSIECSAIERNQSDIVICEFERFSASSEIDYNAITKVVLKDTIEGVEIERRMLCEKNVSHYVSSCGKLFRRDLFKNIRFPEGKLFEDEFITYKLYHKSDRVTVLGVPFYYYYINDAGITRNLNSYKRFDEYDAQWERINFYRSHDEIELLKLACAKMLYSAQWDLIHCRQDSELASSLRTKQLVKEYRKTVKLAKKYSLINMKTNIDYYSIAWPNYKNLWRILRVILLQFDKKL